MRQLTEDEVKVLRQFKYAPDGDLKFWDKVADFYADDPETLKKIEKERKFLLSVRMIPLAYGSYDKTRQMYLESVDELTKEMGYTPEEKQAEIKDNILEKIAAELGIDIDIDHDGVSSLEHYGKKED